MNNKKKAGGIAALVLSFALLTACTAANGAADSANGNAGSANTNAATQSAAAAAKTLETVAVKYGSEDYYFNWKSGSYQTIDLNSGVPAIIKSGVYEITGTAKDGSLVIDVDKDSDSGIVYLVLNNANISSSTSAPIYIKDAEKVVLILENGTANTIYQGSGCAADENNEPSAAVFSKADLTITGGGTFNVTSDYNDGITSKDKLKITDGTLTVKSKADGIVGKDVLAVEKCVITVTAGKDGLRSTNDTEEGKGNIVISNGTFTIDSANDSIQAYGILQIDGGTFGLKAGGGYTGSIKRNVNGPGGMGDFKGQTGGTPGGVSSGSSAGDSTGNSTGSSSGSTSGTDTGSDSKKALKATGGLAINGGTFTISSYEDAVHSGGVIQISGGTVSEQSGDDGIHSDSDVIINGGEINIQNSFESIEGKNITVNSGSIGLTSDDDAFNVNDESGLLTINGGEIRINAGGDGLDSNGSVKMTGGTVYVDGPTDDGNGAIDYNGSFEISGGTVIAAGSSGMAEAPDANSSQASILMYYGTAQAAGTKLTLKDSGGSIIAEYTPSKQYASAAISTPGIIKGQSYTLYSGDTKVVSFTVSDTVTYLNESGITTNQSRGPGDFGGMNGGSRPDGGGKRGWGSPPNGSVPNGTAPGSGPAGSGTAGGSAGAGSDAASGATAGSPDSAASGQP